MSGVTDKLAAARTRLLLDKPFLGALVLRLPLIEAKGNWCDSSATDAISLYYNPKYFEPLSLSQTQFVLAHEAMHCGLSHFARREHRNLHRWNIACDYAVNQMLVLDGLELPPGALHDEIYDFMSAEEIYPLIKKDSEEQTIDQHLYDRQDDSDSAEQTPENPNRSNTRQQSADQQHTNSVQPQPGNQSGAGASVDQQMLDAADSMPEQKEYANAPVTADSRDGPPRPLTPQRREQLNTQWQQRLAGAVQQATAAGRMNGIVALMVDQMLRSTVPWRTLLARYMSGSSRTDYNLLRPTQRRSGDAILPSLHTRQLEVVIALDTSGSIKRDELTEFVAEVNAIKGLVNARITLLACDADLDENGPWVFEAWDQMALPKTFKGDGGTDFIPVFDWMNDNAVSPDLLIYFTDAIGRFPEQAPFIETLWLVKGSANVPWGQRIQLN